MNKAELDEHYEYFTKDNKNESDAIKREKNRAKFISSFKLQNNNTKDANVDIKVNEQQEIRKNKNKKNKKNKDMK